MDWRIPHRNKESKKVLLPVEVACLQSPRPSYRAKPWISFQVLLSRDPEEKRAARATFGVFHTASKPVSFPHVGTGSNHRATATRSFFPCTPHVSERTRVRIFVGTSKGRVGGSHEWRRIHPPFPRRNSLDGPDRSGLV